ncbi:ABC transporter substrate-binding protein [Arhodomonas sp. AD133]|uniref:ABC transporter substrate-binding protein n=1 Tax=Arhodomonas sp. AD133 TaxID=3415009 RepID=UPI003EB7F089
MSGHHGIFAGIRRLVLTVALAISAPAVADFSGGEIRIALVTDYSGIYSDALGGGATVAAELAVAELGGEVAGIPVEIEIVDSGDEGFEAAAQARRLHETAPLDAIVGLAGHNPAIALQRFAREAGVVSINTGSTSPALTQRHCSPLGFHWIFDSVAAGGALTGTLSGAGDTRRVMFFSIPRKVQWQTLRKLRTLSRVETFGRLDHDLVIPVNGGEEVREAIRWTYEYGLMGPDVATAFATQLYLSDVRAIGLYHAQGLVMATEFYWNASEPARRWSDEFARRTGSRPTALQAATYSAVRHYLLSVAAAGKDDSKAVAAAMRDRPVDDIYVENGRIRRDGRLVHDLLIARVKRASDSGQPWDYLDVVQRIPGTEVLSGEQDQPCRPRPDA